MGHTLQLTGRLGPTPSPFQARSSKLTAIKLVGTDITWATVGSGESTHSHRPSAIGHLVCGSLWAVVGHCFWMAHNNPQSERGEWVQKAAELLAHGLWVTVGHCGGTFKSARLDGITSAAQILM